MNIQTVKIKDILPNPYRNLETYPWNEEKIAALIESIHATDFWANVVARPHGDQYQIAYGHHRMEAVRRAYGDDGEVSILVRPLTDSQMLRMMVRENNETFTSSAIIDVEAVQSLLRGLADGTIDDFPKVEPSESGGWRCAPSATVHRGSVAPAGAALGFYNSTAVASYCGWSEIRAKRALSIAEAVELDAISIGDIAGMPLSTAETFAANALRAAREAAKAKAREEQERQRAEERRIEAEKRRREAEEARKKAQAEADERRRREQERRAKEAEECAARAEADRRKAEERAAKEAEAHKAAEEEKQIKVDQTKRALKKSRVNGEQPTRSAARAAISDEIRRDQAETNAEAKRRDPEVAVKSICSRIGKARAQLEPSGDIGQMARELAELGFGAPIAIALQELIDAADTCLNYIEDHQSTTKNIAAAAELVTIDARFERLY